MLDSEMEGDLLKDAAVGGVETDPTGVHTSLKLVDIGQRRSLRVEQVGGNERGIASSQDREVDHIFGRLSMRPVSRQKDEFSDPSESQRERGQEGYNSPNDGKYIYSRHHRDGSLPLSSHWS